MLPCTLSIIVCCTNRTKYAFLTVLNVILMFFLCPACIAHFKRVHAEMVLFLYYL